MLPFWMDLLLAGTRAHGINISYHNIDRSRKHDFGEIKMQLYNLFRCRLGPIKNP